MRAALVLSLLLFATACGLVPRQSGGDILVIGDSVLAWNRFSGQDAGRQIANALGRDVVSRAAPGARIEAGGLGTLGGLSISDQLSGSWNWVVMNGGANDLATRCGCGPCGDQIDRLISADGAQGAIPQLIARARASGAQVLWAGYYVAPSSGSFKGCRPALVEIERRIARLAAAADGLHFADIEDVLDPSVTPGLLAADRTHPSPAGSAVMGGFLAATIAAHSGPTPRQRLSPGQ